MSFPPARDIPATRMGIMGGMFDPVHSGHLQLAEQVHEMYGLDALRLVPCGNPVHRACATATVEQRVHMLELAVKNQIWLQVDARECRSSAPSYTFTTVSEISTEFPHAWLYLLMGLDAFVTLATWHRWRELFGLANLIVVTRPGYAWDMAQVDAGLRAEVESRLVSGMKAFRASRSGSVMLAALPMPAISSSQIRHMVRTGMNTADVLHPAVAGYIRASGLYHSMRNLT